MKVLSSKLVVLAALAGNAAIALTKFVAAFYTGSSAMLSEAIHSLADTGNQGLLLYGTGRGSRPPDNEHPFGHGREVFFWGFVVAIVLFALGAGVSIYEGILKVVQPHPIENVLVSYLVLGASFCFESASAYIGFREFNHRRGERPVLASIRASKDPTLFTVLVEDSIALLGLMIAALGISVAHLVGLPIADGLASIAIGLMLAGAAAFLAYEVKSLLIGEAASRPVRDGARQIIERHLAPHGAIRHINDVRTLQLGPSEALVVTSLDLDDATTARDVEALTARLGDEVRQRHPEVVWLFVDVADRHRYRGVPERSLSNPAHGNASQALP